MKALKNFLKRFQIAFSNIHLVDKCLILFMAVFLAQSSYNLFTHTGAQELTSNIDVIVRTSSAAIFGYIISANFIRHISPTRKDTTQGKQAPRINTPSEDMENKVQNKIGFMTSSQESKVELGDAQPLPMEDESHEDSTAGHIQIIAATIIGLFCLISLILLKNVFGWNDNISTSQATVAQFRDFVSGCVGFLIGSPTTPINKNK